MNSGWMIVRAWWAKRSHASGSGTKGLDDVEFAGAACYRIVVQGFLAPDWGARLGGLVITTAQRARQPPLTTLLGRVSDQAELSGVLNTLHDLHLPILIVERVK